MAIRRSRCVRSHRAAERNHFRNRHDDPASTPRFGNAASSRNEWHDESPDHPPTDRPLSSRYDSGLSGSRTRRKTRIAMVLKPWSSRMPAAASTSTIPWRRHVISSRCSRSRTWRQPHHRARGTAMIWNSPPRKPVRTKGGAINCTISVEEPGTRIDDEPAGIECAVCRRTKTSW